MGIVNKRNAVLGWLTWNVGKRVARKKAKAAVPAIEGGKPNRPLRLAAGLATLGGLLFFWRKKKGGAGESGGGGAAA
jgi:hypothetical protein